MGPEVIAALALINALIGGIQAIAEGKQPTPEQQAALDLSIAAKEKELDEHVARLTGEQPPVTDG